MQFVQLERNAEKKKVLVDNQLHATENHLKHIPNMLLLLWLLVLYLRILNSQALQDKAYLNQSLFF